MTDALDASKMHAAGLFAFERWQQAQRRYERLRGVFDAPACLEAAVRRDRYLRLCAQIAIASDRVEAARDALVAIIEMQDPDGDPH